MIIEQILSDGRRVRHYSDAGVKIRQVDTGIVYDDAVDNYPTAHMYEETDIQLAEEEATPEEILNIILGGAEE